ncbi:phage tail sheath subtilisin-like domain-containing protein [Aquincola tertiaricarbonis]|uniref:Phage tail sheath subtilisin-like domain-containing protein n=1 Tax=Aquincola tertiaricarbonis TaxID=391953 RepID=A0ABY4S7Y5_AQUTE|nr:phage tail sheath subtilisin-like domain-containing protein [Aquincola tertiaricarbonis]URI08066.1 phage tail sheath subtilisin-like domain-containing protein [Aquincola tertiaricarbonis]
MPTPLHIPGVAIDETPTGLRPVAAQPTAVTVFAGRAWRGPVGQPRPLRSLGDFLREFGPAPAGDPLAAAVADFFANGGSQALLLRVYRPPEPESATVPAPAGPMPLPDGCARLALGDLLLRAADPGRWGDGLQVQLGPHAQDTQRFDLWVQDPGNGQAEQFSGLSLQPGHPMEAGPVLQAQSRLLRLQAPVPDAPPPAGTARLLRPGSDGGPLTPADLLGDEAAGSGLQALAAGPAFQLLCLPPPDAHTDWPPALWSAVARLARQQRAVLLIDPPSTWRTVDDALAGASALCEGQPDAALWFPRLAGPDGLRAPCGAVAGVIARTDAQRGVWKAPAGLDARLVGVAGLALTLTDLQLGRLNPRAINGLRTVPGGRPAVWGARTRDGADERASEFKYLPVRRLALHIEDSLLRGLTWAVFEPDAEPLWAQLRLHAGSFMYKLFRQGAFQGSRPADAYFVHCDAATTHAEDQRRGVVRLHVGFAPLRPSEFVVLRLALQATPTVEG